MAIDPLRLPYKARFSAVAHLHRASDAERHEARASVERLRPLLPPEINPDDNPTTLFVVGNLFVAGLLNLNDDAVSIEDSLQIYRRFEGQQINIEHNRASIVGYIIKAGLSEFGTDRLITEDEARAANAPFNVAVVIALWKVADADLTEFLEGSAEPGSPDRNALSLSFEVGFDDYSIVTLPQGVTNLANATSIITSDDRAFEVLSRSLRINKGKGVKGDEKVGRLLGGNIIPLGGGIVVTPAAAVKGLTPVSGPTLNQGMMDEDDAAAGLYKYSSTQVTFSSTDAAPFVEFAKSIPDEAIYTDEADPTLGRELEPHVTCLYGLHDADAAPIQQLLAGAGPITVTLGKMSIFERDDRLYDVLKIDVVSDDLSRLHHLIKASVPNEDKWPTYHPHLTIAYCKRGAAAPYVGDARFEGQTYTFSTLTFSPHTGARTEIPLVNEVFAESVSQVAPDLVYMEEDDSMATASRYIKLSAGWQDKIASTKATAVDVTLSDGRKLLAAKVLDACTLELSEETSLAGVVISELTPVVQTMTPGVGPQADDAEAICPQKTDTYPTVRPEKQAENAAELAEKRAAQEAPLTGPDKAEAAVQHNTESGYQERMAKALCEINSVFSLSGEALAKFSANLFSINQSRIGVSNSSNPSIQTMKLEDLKESLASVKTPEDLTQAVANVALFVESIKAASEADTQARKDAETVAQQAQTTLAEVKVQLEALTATHNEMVAAQAAAAAEAAFQTRMSTVAEVFQFDDDTRAELLDEIKACADEASFEKWLARAKKLFRHYTKDAIAAAAATTTKASDDGDEDDEKKKKMEEDCASAAKTALASAAAAVVDAPINNTVEVVKPSLMEQYKAAFARNVKIDGVSVADLTASKEKKQ